MNDIKRKFDSGDDIRRILGSSGGGTPYLSRLEEVAAKMRQAEWTMMRRAAAASATALSSATSNLTIGT